MDEENTWYKGIEEEMAKVNAAVAELATSPDNLVRYQEIYLHMIFYIKNGENIRRKARLFAGGHNKKFLSSITYISVVLQDSVCICLLIAALNNLVIHSANI